MTVNVLPFDGHDILPQTRAFLDKPQKLLTDGQWVDGQAGETMKTRDPATGLTAARFAIGDASDVDRAVAAARRAFEGPWSRLTRADRTALMNKFGRLIADNADLLMELEVIDSGMPRFIAGLTVANCVEMVDYYAGAILRIEGTTTAPPRHIAAEAEALTYTLREPVGVVAQIIPWNAPLAMAILKLAPALAAGCTVIIKPSEETPLSMLLLGELITEAGFPNGVVNIVNGLGASVGAALSEHMDIDKVSFTGSTATGKRVIVAATGNLKKVTLELGGKSPVVVMPDADMDITIPGVAMATFFLQGQNCMAGTRIFAHAAVHDQLVEGLVAFAKNMKHGHGLDFATMQRPLVSQVQTDKVMAYIDSANAEGATLAGGGQRVDRPGNFVEPTIFTDTTSNMRIVREEVFGPVMAVRSFDTDDLDEIARLANDTPFGLSGSVWTQNLSWAHRLVARIRSGQVSINCHGAVGTDTNLA
jgi:phenylacetaldehyde dehydrogenase